MTQIANAFPVEEVARSRKANCFKSINHLKKPFFHADYFHNSLILRNFAPAFRQVPAASAWLWHQRVLTEVGGVSYCEDRYRRGRQKARHASQASPGLIK